MNKHFKSVLIGSLVLGAAVTACGDDDNTLSETAFREQASAIICDGDMAIASSVGEVFGGGEPTPELMEGALAAIVSASRGQADAIDALAAPSGMASDVDALLAEWRSATSAAESQGLGFFESDEDPWAVTSELADELGLESCGGA